MPALAGRTNRLSADAKDSRGYLAPPSARPSARRLGTGHAGAPGGIAGRERRGGRRGCPPDPGGPAGAERPGSSRPRGCESAVDRAGRGAAAGRTPGQVGSSRAGGGEGEQRREPEQDRAGEDQDRTAARGSSGRSSRARSRSTIAAVASGARRMGVAEDRRRHPVLHRLGWQERPRAGDAIAEVAVDRRDLPAGEDALDDADVVAGGAGRSRRGRHRREPASRSAAGRGRRWAQPSRRAARRGPWRRSARRLRGPRPFVDGARVGVGRGAALQRDARPLPDPGDEQRAPFDARPVGVAVRSGRALAECRAGSARCGRSRCRSPRPPELDPQPEPPAGCRLRSAAALVGGGEPLPPKP